jgi:tetratricopeptide (TPR) repeat protein
MATIEQAFAQAWSSHRSGRLQDAERWYREVLREAPGHSDVWHLLGILCQSQGRLAEAVSSYEEALRLRPEFAEALGNLGVAYMALGRLADAVACYRRALGINPKLPGPHNNLGLALIDQNELDEAAACFREALRLDSNFQEAHYNLGKTLHQQGRLEEAIACYRRSLELRPTCAQAHHNLGVALKAQGKAEEATACLQQALRLEPNFAEAHCNLGLTLLEGGKVDEAMACYAKAIELQPDHADAHVGRGIVWLVQGQVEAGWAELEWRLRCPKYPRRALSRPMWDGSPLDGKTILLYAEMGLGDTIHFIRYASLVKERGGRVVVEPPAALLPILARTPGIDQLVTPETPLPDFEVHAPLPSLPHLLGTTLDTVPANIPYVFADPGLVEQWRRELSAIGDFKIGIAWRGSQAYPSDAQRSIPLVEFAPLAAVEGVRLFSLQKGPGSEELSALRGRFAVTDLAGRLDERTGPFMDTAAVIQGLDLVISVDTSIAHLAGALGAPVWLALGLTPHWLWFLKREDSPWYPRHRLFRRDPAKSWNDVFQRMAAELRRRLQA